MLRITVAIAVLLSVAANADLTSAGANEKNQPASGEPGEWISMWDGRTLDGWKASENKGSWKVVDGTLTCSGKRSHLFYVAEPLPFRNFELECEVMTTPGSNAGIYFHTRYQETGWPKYGHECQVNITHSDPKKSGGLYGVADVANPPAKDNEWYRNSIRVEGRHVVIRINDQVTTDFTEPENQKAFSEDFERRLGEGTIALQAHDPQSVVHFRNLRIRRLP